MPWENGEENIYVSDGWGEMPSVQCGCGLSRLQVTCGS